MKDASRSGIVLAFAGTVVAGLGFLFLFSQGPGACPSVAGTGVNCVMPRSFATLAYYLGTAGGALLLMGIWQARIGRKRIVTEGGWLVSSMGMTLLALGFFGSSLLPFPTTTSAEIGYALGLLGSALMIGGMVKMSAGERGSVSESLAGERQSRLKIQAPAARVLVISICLGLIATIVSGWLGSVNLVTPGGGGVYWGFPLSWKSISAWLGYYNGFQYNWPVFILDSFFYTAAVFFFLYISWLNISLSKTLPARLLGSNKTIALLGMMTIVVFTGSLAYDYSYLWNLWG